MSVTTIGVVSGANVFVTESGVNKGMLVGLMSQGCKPKLSGLLVCAVRVELSEVVTSIGPSVTLPSLPVNFNLVF